MRILRKLMCMCCIDIEACTCQYTQNRYVCGWPQAHGMPEPKHTCAPVAVIWLTPCFDRGGIQACLADWQAGAVTGGIAAFVEGPIDFYKSQIQVQIIRARADPKYKRTSAECIWADDLPANTQWCMCACCFLHAASC